MTIDELLQTPYRIIDILPKRVPQGSPGQYFAIEKYYLEPSRLAGIKQKHINLILKLNCYMDIAVEGEINPPPARLEEIMRGRYTYIMAGDSMILSEPDDTHMTLFNPDGEMLGLVRTLASGEGLFVWPGTP